MELMKIDENFKIKLLKKFPDLNFYETNYKLLNLDEFNINDNFVVFFRYWKS